MARAALCRTCGHHAALHDIGGCIKCDCRHWKSPTELGGGLMKWYYFQRIKPGWVVAWIENDTDEHFPLKHLVKHSPDGFEFGYEGSGPSDLARSIVGDYLDDPNPDPRLYQAFLRAVLAHLETDGPHMVSEKSVRNVLMEAALRALTKED